LIVNLPNGDHWWNNSAFHVFGPWEASEESNKGSVPRIWGSGAVAQGSELVSAESEKRAEKLYGIDHGKHNWSWLLCPNRPAVPPAAPKDKPSTKGLAGSTSGAAGGKSCEDEALPKEEEEQYSTETSLKKRMREKEPRSDLARQRGRGRSQILWHISLRG